MQTLSNDQLFRIAPSIFATTADDKRSGKYRFVPTVDVLDALREEGFQPVGVKTSRSRTEEGAEFVKHHIRMRREQDLNTKLTTFEQVIPELALTNSHNGTSGFILDAALHRLVCKNGLVCSMSQGSLRYRHMGGDGLIGRVIEGAYEIVSDFPRIAETIEEWSGIELSRDQQLAFARAAIPLRFDEELGIQPEQMLMPKRYGDRKPDLFTVFNVVQENVIRGGVSTGRTKRGARQTSREIKSVDRDLKLNRSLWTLASEMAKLVH